MRASGTTTGCQPVSRWASSEEACSGFLFPRFGSAVAKTRPQRKLRKERTQNGDETPNSGAGTVRRQDLARPRREISRSRPSDRQDAVSRESGPLGGCRCRCRRRASGAGCSGCVCEPEAGLDNHRCHGRVWGAVGASRTPAAGYTEEFLAPVRSALHVHLGGPRDARIEQGMPTRPSVTGRRRPPGRPDRKSRIASTVRATTRGVR